MQSEALFHNSAWVLTEQLLQELDCRLGDGNYALVFGRVYIRIKEGLKRYEEQAERVFQRLHPTQN